MKWVILDLQVQIFSDKIFFVLQDSAQIMESFIGGCTQLLIEIVNPFVEMKLISLSYGVLSPENVAFIYWKLLPNVKMKWKSSLMNKLVEQKVGFYKPLKWLKLGTFTKMMKRLVNTKDGKTL